MTSYQYRKSHYGDHTTVLSPQWDFPILVRRHLYVESGPSIYRRHCWLISEPPYNFTWGDDKKLYPETNRSAINFIFDGLDVSALYQMRCITHLMHNSVKYKCNSNAKRVWIVHWRYEGIFKCDTLWCFRKLRLKNNTTGLAAYLFI